MPRRNVTVKKEEGLFVSLIILERFNPQNAMVVG